MQPILILKGFIVGIAKVLPGISGSLLALTLGIYEDLINAVTSFFTNLHHNLKLLFNFCLGLFIAIILGSKFLLYLYQNYYSLTIFFFLGLIIATLIPFCKKIIFTKTKILLIIIIFLFLTLILNNLNISTSIYQNNFFYNFILGIIEASSSIIPGISGTTIYLLLNSYNYVLSLMANPLSFNFFDFLIGILFGTIITCYLMSYLLKKHSNTTYIIILSFMLSSLFNLFITSLSSLNIISFLYLIMGFIIGLFFNK